MLITLCHTTAFLYFHNALQPSIIIPELVEYSLHKIKYHAKFVNRLFLQSILDSKKKKTGIAHITTTQFLLLFLLYTITYICCASPIFIFSLSSIIIPIFVQYALHKILAYAVFVFSIMTNPVTVLF